MAEHRERALHAWTLFLQAHALLINRLEQELEDEDRLPLSWYDVLVQLSLAPDRRLRLQDLVRALVLSKSGLTRRIDRMEEAGLVHRCGCGTDGRGVFACLTDAGAQALAAAKPVHLAGIERHFAAYLDDQEARVMIRALRKIIAGLEARGETVPPCPSLTAAPLAG